MAPAVAAGHDELVKLAELVSRDRSDLPAQGVPVSLLADVMRQVGCHRLIVVGYDQSRNTTWFRQGIMGDGWPERPCLTLLNDMLGLVHWADMWGTPAAAPSARYPGRDEPRGVTGVAAYREVYRSLGLEHQVSLSLAGGRPAHHAAHQTPGHSTAVPADRELRMFLFRCPGPDFSRRDRAVLRLLGPHLRQAYQDAELRRRVRPELTARQWDLLRLVAAGHTNTQIGRRLGISEGTVRKHLENIYGRLGVSSRTAAVTTAFPEQIAI
jgi:DNA-binding CsgD family transcriptional regulator